MCIRLSVYVIGLLPFYGRGLQFLLWAGLWSVLGKITISGIRNILNYCAMFMVYTHIRNVAADCIIQPGGFYVACGPQVEDPWSLLNMVTHSH
jgi:hypothetical protein